MFGREKILWVDGLGGLAVGVAVLALCFWISDWYQMPVGLVAFLGGANLLYGTYSTSLAMRKARPVWTINLLILANFMWPCVCLAVYWQFGNESSIFGKLHLILEGIYVGTLGWIEWRYRNELVGSNSSISP